MTNTEKLNQLEALHLTAAKTLGEIKRRQSLYNSAIIPALKQSYKDLLDISKMRYANTEAAIAVITQSVEVEKYETDAELLQNVDEFMQQLTINATANGLIEPKQSKEGFIQDAKMFFEAENR